MNAQLDLFLQRQSTPDCPENLPQWRYSVCHFFRKNMQKSFT
jgi:hypothetical protein